MYNRSHISSGCRCYHDTLGFVSCSACMCCRFGWFWIYFIFVCFYYYFKLRESYTAPLNVSGYFNESLTSCWKPTNKCMFSQTDTRVEGDTSFMFHTHTHTRDLLSLTVFIFVHPAVKVSVWKVWVFFFPFYVENFLMSFQFVSLVFNCMSKRCVYLWLLFSFFLLILFFAQYDNDVFLKLIFWNFSRAK